MTSTGSGAGGNSGTPKDERVRESANSGARVQAVHTGLKKVVTGRESVIKDQAVKLAEKLDAKTEGRHHQKIRLALLALNSLVDTLGRDGKTDSEGQRPSDAGGSNPSAQRGPSSSPRPSADDPEDIGEFTPRGNSRS